MTANTDEVSILVEHLERYRAVTLQILERVPDGQLSWRVAEGLRSVADHFLHIAQSEEYHARGVFAGDWDDERLKRGFPNPTRQLIEQRLAETRAYTLGFLENLDDVALEAMVEAPHNPAPWPVRSWLWHLVEHEVHHKSQLALYLRQLGIAPPFYAFPFPPGLRPDVA